MKSVCFSFADLTGLITQEKTVELTPNFRPFLEKHKKPDYTLEYLATPELDDLQGELLYSGIEYDVIQKQNDEIIRIFKDPVKNNFIYAYSKMMPFEEKVKIYFLKGNEQYFDNLNNSFFHSGWEQILLWKKRMILHAALIDTEYGGILFSGRSGVGKSTQADLWIEKENAELINGDRPILYRSADEWLGSGSPYAGSSECYVNVSAPVRALFFLEQGEQTSLQRLNFTETVKKVYENCTVYAWNKEFVDRILSLIIELAKEIPAYRLVNKADHEAVETVKQELQKEVIK